MAVERTLSIVKPDAVASGPPGPYVLQAAIAACHARARTADETEWPRIAALYLALSQISPSPVIELNRAVALSMTGAWTDLLFTMSDNKRPARTFRSGTRAQNTQAGPHRPAWCSSQR